MNGESAYHRHLRLAAISTGFGSIVFSLLALGDMLSDFPVLAPGFAWPATILFCGLPIALIPLGRWGSITALRRVAQAHTIVSLILIVGWAPFQVGEISNGGAPWILNTVAVSAASAVVGWRGKTIWIYLFAMVLCGSTLRWIGLGRTTLVIPLEDGLSMLEVSIVIAALLVVSLAAGRAQDEVYTSAIADARGTAEAQSRARQRTRFGALVHDDVITTLLAASQATRRVPAISRSAERAIERLDSFLAAGSDDIALDADLLEVEVRAAVTEVVDGIEFEGSFLGAPDEIPGTVALAITDALREGARNSVRHGGKQDVRRTVSMWADDSVVHVEIVDDGVGFDPTRVSPSRFGIRTSIVDRMASVGGSADIRAAPGQGTTVALEWRAIP